MSPEKLAWLGETASDQDENEALAAYRRRPLEMELRREAAELIEKRGWTQGRRVAPTGEVCLEEALNIVCRNTPLDLIDSTKWGLECELGVQDIIGGDLTQWNDKDGRTVEEVLAALRGTL